MHWLNAKFKPKAPSTLKIERPNEQNDVELLIYKVKSIKDSNKKNV